MSAANQERNTLISSEIKVDINLRRKVLSVFVFISFLLISASIVYSTYNINTIDFIFYYFFLWLNYAAFSLTAFMFYLVLKTYDGSKFQSKSNYIYVNLLMLAVFLFNLGISTSVYAFINYGSRPYEILRITGAALATISLLITIACYIHFKRILRIKDVVKENFDYIFACLIASQFGYITEIFGTLFQFNPALFSENIFYVFISLMTIFAAFVIFGALTYNDYWLCIASIYRQLLFLRGAFRWNMNVGLQSYFHRNDIIISFSVLVGLEAISLLYAFLKSNRINKLESLSGNQNPKYNLL